MSGPVHVIVWSDYLCPWCYVAEHRLERVLAQYGDDVQLEWRTYLLRPQPDPSRTLEQFRRYTQSWLRPAAECDAPRFEPWHSDAGPPSHSVPPHLVSKAAAMLGRDAFRRMHCRLLEAYFTESRDITDADTLLTLWTEAGLPPEDFARTGDAAVLQQVVDEHNAAVNLGLNGVPAVMLRGGDVPVMGALPSETYRRWVERALARS